MPMCRPGSHDYQVMYCEECGFYESYHKHPNPNATSRHWCRRCNEEIKYVRVSPIQNFHMVWRPKACYFNGYFKYKTEDKPEPKPTDKQLAAIAIIEKKLPFAVFTGTTLKEASDFIAKYIEASKRASVPRRTSSYEPRYKSDNASSHTQNDRERYEKYIDEISWNYVEAAGDDGWGGIASRNMARQLHPFEEWQRSCSR